MKSNEVVKFTVDRIMLVDDSRIDNFINHKVLLQSGISTNIEVFSNPEKALKHLENGLPDFPDLILLDALMPKIDGFDFIEALRKFPADVQEKTTIIVLSNLLPDITMRKMILYPEVSKWMQKPLLVSNVNTISDFLKSRVLAVA